MSAKLAWRSDYLRSTPRRAILRCGCRGKRPLRGSWHQHGGTWPVSPESRVSQQGHAGSCITRQFLSNSCLTSAEKHTAGSLCDFQRFLGAAQLEGFKTQKQTHEPWKMKNATVMFISNYKEQNVKSLICTKIPERLQLGSQAAELCTERSKARGIKVLSLNRFCIP